jgi:hypothetical protein
MRCIAFLAAALLLVACSHRPKPESEEREQAVCALAGSSLPVVRGERRASAQPDVSLFNGGVSGASPLDWNNLRLCEPRQIAEWVEQLQDEAERRLRRASLVGATRAASVRRCADYLELLTEVDRENNLRFGGAATILGALGAIISPATRSLSGAASIASGLRAEFNAQTFYNQAIGAIRKAIDQRMAERWTAIEARLQKDDYASFPALMALAAVEDLHAQCSISAGFAQIQDALVRPLPVGSPTAGPPASVKPTEAAASSKPAAQPANPVPAGTPGAAPAAR